MPTSQDIAEKLKEIKPYLKDKFQVSKIGYFGSFAEDRATTDSDIDILVEFSATPGWEFFHLEEYLESIFDRKIDLVTKAALKERLKDRILQQIRYIE